MDVMEMGSDVWNWCNYLVMVSAAGSVWFPDSASIEQVTKVLEVTSTSAVYFLCVDTDQNFKFDSYSSLNIGVLDRSNKVQCIVSRFQEHFVLAAFCKGKLISTTFLRYDISYHPVACNLANVTGTPPYMQHGYL